jgi:hypothetical protein
MKEIELVNSYEHMFLQMMEKTKVKRQCAFMVAPLAVHVIQLVVEGMKLGKALDVVHGMMKKN